MSWNLKNTFTRKKKGIGRGQEPVVGRGGVDCVMAERSPPEALVSLAAVGDGG